MVSLAVDKKGNLIVGSEFELVKNDNSIVQDIRTRLKLVQSENPFNIDDGIPYFDMMMRNNKKSFENEIYTEIMKDERIKSASVEAEFKDGVLNMEITIITYKNEQFTI